MTVYQPPQFDVDRDAILQNMIADMQTAIPNLQVAEGTLLWALLSTIATRHADQLELLMDRAEGEFQAFGEKVLRIPTRAATPAETTVTITAADTLGHTIDAGTEISLLGPDGERVAFAVRSLAIIAPGDTVAAGVTITAVEPGAAGTGLSLDPQLERTLSWVSNVTVDAQTTGGEDAENADDYVDRLSDELTLLANTLTIPAKFETFARHQPGVARAMALDLYDADTDTPGVGGHITVAVIDEIGGTIGTKADIEALMEANAVTGLDVHVIDPTYTPITVAFTGVSYSSADAAAVEAAAEQAVLDFLSPGNWGRPPFSDLASATTWADTPTVRFQDVSAVLNGVEGLDYWTALTINGGTADVTLTGPAGLPSPPPATTVSGTVS